MDQIARAFQRTLERVAAALHESFSAEAVAPRWGVAGFREETLVFLLAETMRALGWACEYEQGYGPGTRRRGDVLATRPDARSLWIEAKWWWFDVSLEDVLNMDKMKLRAVKRDHRPIAAVFTVDADGVQDAARKWTVSKAESWLAADTPVGWKLVGLCALPSAYHGTSLSERRPKKDRGGVFAAAFFELVE